MPAFFDHIKQSQKSSFELDVGIKNFSPEDTI